MRDLDDERAANTARQEVMLTLALFILHRLGGEREQLQQFRQAWHRGDSYNMYAILNPLLARHRHPR
ncbi:MAG TPA: hypothetical protein VD978_31490 [Azospirillum sp.]|nr:hypothetical protein [Azospirillum sp.]